MSFYYILREQKNLQMVLNYLSDEKLQGFFKGDIGDYFDEGEKITSLEDLLKEDEVTLNFGDCYNTKVRIFSLEELKEKYSFLNGYVFQETYFYWEEYTQLSRKTKLYQTPDSPLTSQNNRYKDQGEHTYDIVIFYCQQISE